MIQFMFFPSVDLLQKSEEEQRSSFFPYMTFVSFAKHAKR